MQKIQIETKISSFTAKLNESETAKLFTDQLPITNNAITWGGEIYFEVPFHTKLDSTAQEEVPAGGLAFWPEGNMFCIFFGKTPASINDEPRAYSAVNIFGQIEGDLSALHTISNGDKITITAID